MKDKFLDGNSIEDIFNGIKEGNISGRDIKVWTKLFSHKRPHLTSFDLIWPEFHPRTWKFQKWIKQKWEDSDFMNSTEEEQWNKITKMFDAIGIDIESVFNHIESLLGIKVEQSQPISFLKNL